MILRLVIASFLALHGLIHTLGFTATRRIAPGGAVAASPNLLPSVASSGAVVRLLGLFWLLVVAGFLGSAAGLAFGASWWKLLLAAASAMSSLTLCLALME